MPFARQELAAARDLPRAALAYIGLVVALACAALSRAPTQHLPWATVGVLTLFLVASESYCACSGSRHVSVSTGCAITLAAAVLVGPYGAAVVNAAYALAFRVDAALVKRVFNGAQIALSGFAGGVVYLAAGGVQGPLGPADFPAALPPFAAALLAAMVVNSGLVAIVVRLAEGEPIRAVVGVAGSIAFSYIGFAGFGLLIAALWGMFGPFAALLVLLPVTVGKWAFDQHEAHKRACESTIAALCQAVETKDLYTRGHSERVGRAVEMLGRALGIRDDRLTALRYAGMLHDLGKLGVPTKVLQKTGPLTDEEFAAIQLHPMRGLEIVRDIDFLEEAWAGIMHHHERVDGSGYPMGLAGDAIPEFARIIAVADAFDSMTSTRSYRSARTPEQAVRELRRFAGTQFDSRVVRAFVRAVERGWRPPVARPAAPGDAIPLPSHDHDDPESPPRLTEGRKT